MLRVFLGAAAFIVEGAKLDAPDTDPNKETEQQYPLCNREKKLREMRGHVGRHILSHSRGTGEHDLLKPVGLPFQWLMPNANPCRRLVMTPCGFCGGGLCNTTLVVTGAKRKVKSDCQLHCSFKYGSA